MKLNKVIAIAGPTGSGKTNLAIELAEHYDAVIINLDSVQIYKELNIGSAKPTKEEREKIQHYLVDIASIYEPKNSFYIFQESYNLIKKLSGSNNIILTGGTGLYYKNLLWGMFSTPSFSPEYRENLKQKSKTQLWEELLEKDPKAAAKIHPNDSIRVFRALEVLHVSGCSIVDLREQQNYTPPADFLLLGISYPREVLYERINKRVLFMIDSGLVEELEAIMHNSRGLPPLLEKIIGYKELIPYLQKRETLQECISTIQQNSRRYAKRQLTLFKHIPNIQWFTNPEVYCIIDYIDTYISSESSI